MSFSSTLLVAHFLTSVALPRPQNASSSLMQYALSISIHHQYSPLDTWPSDFLATIYHSVIHKLSPLLVPCPSSPTKVTGFYSHLTASCCPPPTLIHSICRSASSTAYNSLVLLAAWNIVVSSAYCSTSDWLSSLGMSLTCVVNRRGVRIDSCGTPFIMLVQPDFTSPTQTLCRLPIK